MSKEYVLSEKKVTALARSKRRREGGVGGGAGHRSSGGVVSEDEAGWADRAGYAERAGEAVEAGHAERADEAIEAGHAESADEALEAVHAETADEAIEAGHAECADVSGRLSGDTVRMAWGQAFWEGGQPKDVSGSLTGVVDVTMTGDLSVGGDADIQGDAGIGGTVTVGGSGVASSDFRTGVSGFKLKRGSGGSELEIDRLYVRMKAYFDTLEIRRYIHSGGNRVASAAGCKLSRVISSSNGNLYRCYFKASDGYNKITNDWVAGDLAYCHTTNLANNSNLNQKYYWRLVVHTGGVNAARQVVVMDGTEYQREDMVITEHFIDLSNKSTETLTIDDEPLLVDGYDSGSDIPAAEDDVVQLGNVNDDTRRGAIVESVSGILSAPTYRLYQDIGSDIGDLYSLPDAKVDMGYNLSTKRAYLNVYGDFVFGSRSSGGSRISYNSSTGVLEIKAVIAASSPLSGDGIGPNVTLASYVADAVNNSEQDISAAYGYLAANLARKSVTSITGGLILSSLIGLRNTGGVVTAGINGQNEASGIALWLGGPMADIQNRRTGESVFAKTLLRFDGSGYLAGGNISWKEDGDTEVKGTIRAKNLFHNVCVFSDGGTYFGQDGDAWWYDPTDGTYENNPEVTDGKFQCTYDADVIILLPRGAQSWSDITPVLLPDPKDFAGKSVDVICMASSVGANGNVLVGSVGAGVAWYDGVLVGSAYKMGTLLYTNTEGDRYSVQLYNSQQHCYVSSPMQKSTFVSIRNGNNWYWCLVDSKYVDSGGGQQYVTRQDLDNAVDGFVRLGNSLSHYGILDAKIENGVITLGGNTITPLTQHQSLSGCAQIGAHNNLTASSNEFTCAASGQSGTYYINYRTAGGSNGSITGYHFCDGAGNTLASISNGQFSGNAASADYAGALKDSGNTKVAATSVGATVTGVLTSTAGFTVDNRSYNISVKQSLDVIGSWPVYNIQFLDTGTATANVCTFAFNGTVESSNGFKKTGSSDDNVLLGGGGTKAVTDFIRKNINGSQGDLELGTLYLNAEEGLYLQENIGGTVYDVNIWVGSGNNSHTCHFDNSYNDFDGYKFDAGIETAGGLTINDTLVINRDNRTMKITPTNSGYFTNTVAYTLYDNSGNALNSANHYFTGNIVASGSITQSSDIRKKDVSEYLKPSVYDMAQAPIVKFRWKGDTSGRELVGTVAQYWREVMPQIVGETPDGMLTMDYATAGVVAGVTAARKAVELERRIEEQDRRIEELEQIINQLKGN